MISILRDLLNGGKVKSQLVRGGIGNLILRVAFTLVSFVTGVVLARLMGAGNFGVYSYIYAIVMVLAIPAQFGLPMLMVRETAQALARQDWGEIRGLWQWGGKITGLLTVVIVLGTVGTVLVAGSHFSRDQIQPLVWGLVLVPLTALGALRGAALRGLHKVVAGQLPELAFLPGFFLIFLLVTGYIFEKEISPSLAMFLQAAAALLAFIVGALILARLTPPEVLQAQPVDQHKRWLASIFSLALVSGMQVINKWVSVIILGLFVIPSEVGIYRLAVQMALLADLGLQVVNPVISPQIARLYAMGDMARLQRLATSSARIVLVFNLVVTASFILLGRPFLSLFFGPEFEGSYTALLILLVGQLINSLTGSVAQLLNMTEYEKETAKARGMATIVNIALNFLLSSLYGVTGAAVAASVSIIFWNVMLWRLVHKRLGINSLAFGKPGLFSLEKPS